MASHVVGVAGVDNGEDDEGSQHRRVRQRTTAKAPTGKMV